MIGPLQFLQGSLDFFSSARRFILINQCISLDKILLFSLVKLHSQLLIKFCCLFSQITASCMNDKIICSVRSPVNLYKMIASAQCSQTPLQPFCILKTPVTAQTFQVKTCFSFLPDIFSGRNKVGGLIQPLHRNLTFTKIHCVHTASYIHAHHIGNCFVRNGHSSSDRTSFSGVYIRHNTDFAACCKFIVTHPLYLIHCLLPDHFCKTDRCADLAFDF